MKKLFVMGALVLGTAICVQAQTPTTQDVPQKNGNQVNEAPAPSTNRSATGLKGTTAAPAPSTTTQERNPQVQPGTGTARPTAPGEPVIINGNTPVQTRPVKTIDTPTAPKNN